MISVETVIEYGCAAAVVAPGSVRVFGDGLTLLVFLASGVAAHAVSTAGWSPYGGGDSVAICGLVGALAVWYLLRGAGGPRWVLPLVPAAGVALCALRNNHGVGVLVGCAFGVLLAVLPATRRVPAQVAG
jgi:rhomboid protease GluP